MKSSQLLKSMKKDAAHHEHELAVVKEANASNAAKFEAAKFASAELTTVDQLSNNQRSHYVRRFREWFGADPDSDVPHPIAEHERNASLGRWGSKLLMGFEVAFAAWLTATFNFAQHLWTAMAVTASLWLAASSGLARLVAMLLKRRSEVPHETRNRIHKAIRVFLVTWLAAAALILIMRTAQGKTALVLARFTTYTLAVWAIDTILLAGCGICADRLFGWSGEATREYYAITRMRNRLSHLLSRSGNAADALAERGSATPAIAGKLAMLVAAVALAFTATARAQTPPPNSAGGCTFLDQTTSVDPAALKAVLESHKQVVPAIVQSQALASWCFVPFTGNAWSAQPADTMRVPELPQQACSAPRAGEADSLFRGAREEHAKKAQEACAAARTRAVAKISGDMSIAIEHLEHGTPAGSRCSSVLDAIDRAASTPGLADVVIVTDGQENCGAWRSIPAPNHPLRSVVVLVPSVRDADSGVSPAVLFARRKAALLRSAPWLSAVTPAWGFTADSFQSGETAANLARK